MICNILDGSNAYIQYITVNTGKLGPNRDGRMINNWATPKPYLLCHVTKICLPLGLHFAYMQCHHTRTVALQRAYAQSLHWDSLRDWNHPPLQHSHDLPRVLATSPSLFAEATSEAFNNYTMIYPVQIIKQIICQNTIKQMLSQHQNHHLENNEHKTRSSNKSKINID